MFLMRHVRLGRNAVERKPFGMRNCQLCRLAGIGGAGTNHRMHATSLVKTSPQQLEVITRSSSDSHESHSLATTPNQGTVPLVRETRQTTSVKFRLRYEARFGQRIKVVGNCQALGNWSHLAGPELEWGSGHLWHVDLNLPRGSILEYKFVVLENDGVTPAEWQNGNNAVLPLKNTEENLEVLEDWHNAPGSSLTANGQTTTRSAHLQQWADSMTNAIAVQRAEVRSTRMELFQAQEAARESNELACLAQNELMEAVQDIKEMAQHMTIQDEENSKLRLQLFESQTMFKSAMAEARSMIMDAYEDEDSESEDPEYNEQLEYADQELDDFYSNSDYDEEKQRALQNLEQIEQEAQEVIDDSNNTGRHPGRFAALRNSDNNRPVDPPPFSW